MKIHKEGFNILKIQIIIYILIGASTLFNNTFIYYINPILLIIFILSVYFFRIPKREFNIKDGLVYAPCDGKIVVIEETLENEYYQDNRIQISIFMSPLNIHNNLNPITGKVKYKKYHPGKFLVAWNPKSSIDNERNTIVIENNKISLLARQIAGAIARRIITYPELEEEVYACEELGFIKFGSRVDLFLPIETKINVKLNNNVIGGKSIIATY